MEEQMKVTVLVPTRDRPANARRLLQSWGATAKRDETELWFVLDRQSPMINQYFQIFNETGWRKDMMPFMGAGNMVERTNAAAKTVARHTDIIGWAADDNLFVTEGWDVAIIDEFEQNPGLAMVNTNDLLVGDEKAGVPFVRSSVVQSLGYFFLPTCQHLYVDFALNELMKAAGAQKYREDIVIEHLHPYANKAQWDEAYAAYNTPMQDSKDGRAFSQWRRTAFDQDIEKVKLGLAS
jgi:hypothetical protein